MLKNLLPRCDGMSGNNLLGIGLENAPPVGGAFSRIFLKLLLSLVSVYLVPKILFLYFPP